MIYAMFYFFSDYTIRAGNEQKPDASIVGMLHGEFLNCFSAKLTLEICACDLQRKFEASLRNETHLVDEKGNNNPTKLPFLFKTVKALL
jgi:hypothetical protein